MGGCSRWKGQAWLFSCYFKGSLEIEGLRSSLLAESESSVRPHQDVVLSYICVCSCLLDTVFSQDDAQLPLQVRMCTSQTVLIQVSRGNQLLLSWADTSVKEKHISYRVGQSPWHILLLKDMQPKFCKPKTLPCGWRRGKHTSHQ